MLWVFTRNSVVVVLLLLSSCRQHGAAPAKIYLASSLAPLSETIKAISTEPVDVVFLSSSAIAKQIAQGAPCEVGILADEVWRDYLLDRHVITAESKTMARNSLVLASLHREQGTASDVLAAFPSTEKIIIADPDYVPLGAYTKEALVSLGLYDKLKPSFVHASSARQAQIMLEEKAANFAILYHSDAINAELAWTAALDEKSHRPIRYPLIVCQAARKDKMPALWRIMASEEWRRALISLGLQ